MKPAPVRKRARKTPGPKDATRAYAAAVAARKAAEQTYVLKLYVTGATPNSLEAIRNIKRLCEEHLGGRYNLEVIDIYQQPVLARGEQIIAAPTLIRKLPLPLRRLIGNMSNTDKILLGFDIKPKADGEPRG